MTTLELDRIFQGRRVPPWLEEFETDPQGALQDLLVGRATLGHLNADEPSEVLLDWLESLGSEFIAEVDTALARWIEHSWGRTSLPIPGASPAVLAQAWVRVGDLIASEPGLGRAAESLRALLLKDREFLSALAEGRARDPEGRAWLALARHQSDRSLLPEWWRLCELPPDVLWSHGGYGIHGLRGLPAERPEREGLFSQEVAEGLARLADALAVRVEDGWLRLETARDEFSRVAELTMAAYGAPERWVSFWRHSLQTKRIQAGAARSWVEELFPKQLKDLGKPAKDQRKRWAERDPDWPQRAQRIAAALKQGDWSVLDQARKLLGEQGIYAEATGDSYNVVHSACNFAARVRESRPDLALEWADLARHFDSLNAFAWTTRAASLLELGRLEEALSTALKAVQRFPQDVVARNGLGEVLKAQGRLEESEAVYRETMKIFPNDVFARNGLGEVLKAQGRLEESEVVYRETVKLFPRDVVARTGLGDVLKAQDRLEESEAVYRETVERFPGNVYAKTGLQSVLRAQSGMVEQVEESVSPDTREALHTSRKGPQSGLGETLEVRESPAIYMTRTDIVILLQDVYLLRRWGGSTGFPGAARERARRLLSTLMDDGGGAEIVGTLGLLEIEDGNLEEALALLREAARRYPGSARVRYSLARAEREAATRRGRLDLSNPEAPVLSWRRLGRLDERFRPLQLLGEVRTWLGQTDGSIVADNARNCLDQLGWWLSRSRPVSDADARKDLPETSKFISWWASEVQGHVFESGLPVGGQSLTHLGIIQERFDTHAVPLNRLEEDWLGHFARA